jgi:hypothetical protein
LNFFIINRTENELPTSLPCMWSYEMAKFAIGWANISFYVVLR